MQFYNVLGIVPHILYFLNLLVSMKTNKSPLLQCNDFHRKVTFIHTIYITETFLGARYSSPEPSALCLSVYFFFFLCCMSSGSFLNMALCSVENCIRAFKWKQWKEGRSPDSLYSLCCKKVTLSFYPRPGCISWQIYDRLDSLHHLFQITEQVAMTLENNGNTILVHWIKAFCPPSVFALEAKLLERKKKMAVLFLPIFLVANRPLCQASLTQTSTHPTV